jgi:NAD-dependent deacetylase
MEETVVSALERAAEILRNSHRLIAFTGAGISVESGVPTFRGEGGLYESMDPSLLEIHRFNAEPAVCWAAIRDIFYSANAEGKRPEPNAAHRVLAKWEGEGRLHALITQNIDGFHTRAGSRNVIEFHGSTRELVCLRCGERLPMTAEALDAGLLDVLPPRCASCGGILKPDFVFFGEGIPQDAYQAAFEAAAAADACIVVGSTGVVYPAAGVPIAAKRAGAKVIEVDPGETEFSSSIADVHVRLGAVEALTRLDDLM